MRKLIKKIENPEMFLEAPLLIIAAGTFASGLSVLEGNYRGGVALIAFSAVLVIIEKYIERVASE